MAVSYRVVALTVSTALFMQYLDGSALYTAIPTMARELGVEAVDLNLAVLSYALSLTVLIPVGSAVADRIGQRNAFGISLLVFAAGSILCALSSSLPALVAARALQGAGGAVMMPVSRLLVIRTSRKSELMSAMNWLVLPGIMGPMLGPGIGGFIVEHASWRWIFLVNVPIAVAGMVLTFLLVPNIHDRSEHAVDYKGLALVGPAIFALAFGIESAAGSRPAWLPLGLLALGAVLFWRFVRHARRHPAPVLDLALFRVGSFRHSLETGTLIRTVAAASGFIMPLWFQLGMGLSPGTTGAILVLPTSGVIIARIIGLPLTRILHPRTVAICGAAAFALTLFVNSGFEKDWPYPLFVVALTAQATALSVAMMVVNASAYVDIETGRMSAATALFSTVQQLTLSFGVMVGVWTLTATQHFQATDQHDPRTYASGIALLGILALAGIVIARKLDAAATGALRAAAK